ncbi:MAG: hypothetical protein ACI9C4_000554 [Paraglaciecola sp.]|jgi:hypothetical protein
MQKRMIMAIAGSCLALSNHAFSQAEVEVTWQNPEEYRDVRPANESRKRFANNTFNKLDGYLGELAESLPEGQKLLMTVTNLDLAGEVWPASFVGLGHSGSNVRLIKSIYIPRMTFSYQLLGRTGEVLQQGEEKLKDTSFQDRANRFFDSEPLRYEKNMLRQWFVSTFAQEGAKN